MPPAQKESIEQAVRYEMMRLMRSGILENDIDVLEHARYLSPVVVMGDEYGSDALNQSWGAQSQLSGSSVLTVTQSILIIATCVAIIGAAGLVLTVKILFRKYEDFHPSPKNSIQISDDDSMIPQWSKRSDRTWDGAAHGLTKASQKVKKRHEEPIVVSNKIHFQAESGESSASVDTEVTSLDWKTTKPRGHRGFETVGDVDASKVDFESSASSSSNSNDWGTSTCMTTTMRRAVVTKKVPVAGGRKPCQTSQTLSAIEEDDETSLFGNRSSSSPHSVN